MDPGNRQRPLRGFMLTVPGIPFFYLYCLYFFLADQFDAAVIENLLVLLTAVDQGMGTKSIDLPWTAMGVFLDLGDGFI